MNIADLTSLDLDAAIDLFELKGYNIANLAQTFRFSSNYGVTFSGNAYQPLACKIDGIVFSGTGSLPQAKLTLADPMGVVTTIVYANRIGGATLSYTQTRAKFLDGASNANSTKFLPKQVFSVSHPENLLPNKEMTFVLEPEIYKLRNQIGRRVAASCQAVYMDGVTCPYVGGLTTCNKRVTGSGGCEGHFVGKQLPALSVGFFAERVIR